MNIHSAYQHNQLHSTSIPQQSQYISPAGSTNFNSHHSEALNKFKLRFLPSDEYTKTLLTSFGKKLFLDLTLKKTKTWRSVLEYLVMKWSDIPNILNRLQLYYVDNSGNLIGNLIFNLNLPVVDSLYQHPSMGQLTALVNDQQGPVFPLFYLLLPDDSYHVQVAPEPQHNYENLGFDAHHDVHMEMHMDMNEVPEAEEEMVNLGAKDTSSFSSFPSLISNSLLEPFPAKKSSVNDVIASSSIVDNFSRFPEPNSSFFGAVGDSCLDNILANSSILMGAGHSVGGHEFSRLLKNISTCKESSVNVGVSASLEDKKEEVPTNNAREESPPGKLKHSFSHIFENSDSNNSNSQKLELESSSRESSPKSVTDAKCIEEKAHEVISEKDSKRKFSDQDLELNVETNKKSEEPPKKKKKVIKQKKANPLRIFTTPLEQPKAEPLNGKSFISKLSRVGRSRPELRRINPTFVQPL